MNIQQAHEYLKLHAPTYAKVTIIDKVHNVKSFDFIIPKVKLNDPANIFKKNDAVFTFSDDGSGTVLFIEQTGNDFDIEHEQDIVSHVLSFIKHSELRNMNESKLNESHVTPEMLHKDHNFQKIGRKIYEALMLSKSKKAEDLEAILEAFKEGLKKNGVGYMMNFTFLNEGKVKEALIVYQKKVKTLLKNDKLYNSSEFNKYMMECFNEGISAEECVKNHKK